MTSVIAMIGVRNPLSAVRSRRLKLSRYQLHPDRGLRIPDRVVKRYSSSLRSGTGMDDLYNLARFVAAQDDVYETALAEIRSGRKKSHWMWYVFPQFEGLGFSWTSREYSIKSVAEAEAYLAHPVLGPRLLECAEAVLAVDGRSAADIFGFPDDLKLRSCATLFASVSPEGSVFHRVIDKYFRGERDEKTVRLMG
jgi:uncharacterized protein (DUF1810 family)